MTQVKLNASLQSYNSFGIEAVAEEFVEVTSINELKEATDCNRRLQIMGGGTNLILLDNIPGRTVRVCIKEKSVLTNSRLRLGAGENWNDIVNWSLELGLGGLENLAFIPGVVGAAPYQNIGAYGRELADVVDCVEVFDLTERSLRRLDRDDCKFEYRDSRFKTGDSGRFVIVAVELDLSSVTVDTSYPGLNQYFSENKSPDRKRIAQVVKRIRSEKLPDPLKVGNVGSFFKNHLVERDVFRRLAEEISAPGFAIGDGIKVPAAYLIDSLGWRERDIKGPVGIWPDHSLVLYNRGGARGKDVLSLSHSVAESVHNQFGIELEREPLVWGE